MLQVVDYIIHDFLFKFEKSVKVAPLLFSTNCIYDGVDTIYSDNFHKLNFVPQGYLVPFDLDYITYWCHFDQGYTLSNIR